VFSNAQKTNQRELKMQKARMQDTAANIFFATRATVMHPRNRGVDSLAKPLRHEGLRPVAATPRARHRDHHHPTHAL